MSENEADKILDEIRERRGPIPTNYIIRIKVPFWLDVAVTALSSERALRMVRWDLMPEDREHLLNTARWEHLYGKQFECSIDESSLSQIHAREIPFLETLMENIIDSNSTG